MVISTHLPPPVMMESTAVREAITHMLCWSCAMCFSAAPSSERAIRGLRDVRSPPPDRATRGRKFVLLLCLLLVGLLARWIVAAWWNEFVVHRLGEAEP